MRDDTFEVAAAELNRRFGEIRHRARSGPVAVTHHGRRTLYLLSAEHFDGLAHQAPDPGEAAAARRELRRVTDQIPQGYFALDREGRIRHVNKAAELFVGRDADELAGKSYEELFPALEDRSAIRRVLAMSQVVTVERGSIIHPHRRIQLVFFPLPEPDRGIGILVSNQTESERVSALAEEQNAAIAALLDVESQISFMVGSDGRIEHWGKAAASVLGWPPGEVLARPEAFVVATSEADGVFLLNHRDGGTVRATGERRSLAADNRAALYLLQPDPA